MSGSKVTVGKGGSAGSNEPALGTPAHASTAATATALIHKSAADAKAKECKNPTFTATVNRTPLNFDVIIKEYPFLTAQEKVLLCGTRDTKNPMLELLRAAHVDAHHPNATAADVARLRLIKDEWVDVLVSQKAE